MLLKITIVFVLIALLAILAYIIATHKEGDTLANKDKGVNPPEPEKIREKNYLQNPEASSTAETAPQPAENELPDNLKTQAPLADKPSALVDQSPESVDKPSKAAIEASVVKPKPAAQNKAPATSTTATASDKTEKTAKATPADTAKPSEDAADSSDTAAQPIVVKAKKESTPSAQATSKPEPVDTTKTVSAADTSDANAAAPETNTDDKKGYTFNVGKQEDPSSGHNPYIFADTDADVETATATDSTQDTSGPTKKAPKLYTPVPKSDDIKAKQATASAVKETPASKHAVTAASAPSTAPKPSTSAPKPSTSAPKPTIEKSAALVETKPEHPSTSAVKTHSITIKPAATQTSNQGEDKAVISNRFIVDEDKDSKPTQQVPSHSKPSSPNTEPTTAAPKPHTVLAKRIAKPTDTASSDIEAPAFGTLVEELQLDPTQLTLDLAQQYLEVGEYDSAKRLVREVITAESATAAQKQSAQSVLDRLY